MCYRQSQKGWDRHTGKASYGVKGPTQKGLPSQKPGRWQQGLYGQGKGCTTGTGARTALGAVRAQGKGWRAEPLHAKTRYTDSSWSSKPNRADAPRRDQ
jgi:hypothetical protein